MIKKSFIFIIISLMLTSCFKYEEVLTLNDDRSGTVEINIELGRFISWFSEDGEEDLENFDLEFGDIEGIAIVDKKDREIDGKRTLTILLSFDNIDRLTRLKKLKYRDSRKNKGSFHVSDFFQSISFYDGTYTRVIELENDIESNEDDEVPWFIRSFIDIDFIFHLKINDHEESWAYNLDDLAKKENLKMTYTLK